MMSYDTSTMPLFVVRYQGCSEDTFLVQGSNAIEALDTFMKIWDIGPEHLESLSIQRVTVVVADEKVIETIKKV